MLDQVLNTPLKYISIAKLSCHLLFYNSKSISFNLNDNHVVSVTRRYSRVQNEQFKHQNNGRNVLRVSDKNTGTTSVTSYGTMSFCYLFDNARNKIDQTCPVFLTLFAKNRYCYYTYALACILYVLPLPNCTVGRGGGSTPVFFKKTPLSQLISIRERPNNHYPTTHHSIKFQLNIKPSNYFTPLPPSLLTIKQDRDKFSKAEFSF